jgi:hypothetical protein
MKIPLPPKFSGMPDALYECYKHERDGTKEPVIYIKNHKLDAVLKVLDQISTISDSDEVVSITNHLISFLRVEREHNRFPYVLRDYLDDAVLVPNLPDEQIAEIKRAFVNPDEQYDSVFTTRKYVIRIKRIWVGGCTSLINKWHYLIPHRGGDFCGYKMWKAYFPIPIPRKYVYENGNVSRWLEWQGMSIGIKEYAP